MRNQIEKNIVNKVIRYHLLDDIEPVNNKELNKEDMNPKIEQVNQVIEPTKVVKKEKKDKSLIERTTDSVVVLTEDNKELLKG